MLLPSWPWPQSAVSQTHAVGLSVVRFLLSSNRASYFWCWWLLGALWADHTRLAGQLLPRVGVAGRGNLCYWTPVPRVGARQWREVKPCHFLCQVVEAPCLWTAGTCALLGWTFRLDGQILMSGMLVDYFFDTCVQLLLRGFSSVCFLELDIGLCKGEMACHLQFPLQIFRKGKMEWNLDILESGW